MFSKEKKALKALQAETASALISAINARDLSAVQSFLSGEQRLQVDLNDRNVYLHAAVRHGTPEILAALLQAGADPRIGLNKQTNLRSDAGRTPLFVAIELNKIDMARVLFSDPRTDSPDYQSLSESHMGLSARGLARHYNLAAEWDELFDLVEARRFMAKFKKAQAILEKAGELPKSEAPKPKKQGGLNL